MPKTARTDDACMLLHNAVSRLRRVTFSAFRSVFDLPLPVLRFVPYPVKVHELMTFVQGCVRGQHGRGQGRGQIILDQGHVGYAYTILHY